MFARFQITFVLFILAGSSCFAAPEPQAPAAQETSSQRDFAPGPLLEKRKALYKRILSAKERGIGTKTYLDAFELIETMTKEGKDEAAIKSRIESISRSLEEQFGYTLEPKWDPYYKELIRKLEKNWHPSSQEKAYRVTFSFRVLKDGTLTPAKVLYSSGPTAANQEAVDAVKRTSPYRPWPAVPSDKLFRNSLRTGLLAKS